MKRILLHLQALAVLLPTVLVVNDGCPAWNLLGLAYVVLLCKLSRTLAGKRFTRRYYREILRCERFLA